MSGHTCPNYLLFNIGKLFSGLDKPVYKTAPLYEVIGTHAARRTFVVHALEEGMSPEMVMTFTGHADYDSMKPYIAIADKKRQSVLLDSFKM